MKWVYSLEILSPILAFFALLFGAVAWAGWIVESPVLQGLSANLIQMNPTSALCVILAGVSVLIHNFYGRSKPSPDPQRQPNKEKLLFILSKFLGFVVALIVVLRLFSYGDKSTFGFGFSVDQLFFQHSLGNNRMPPNSALALLFLGFALGNFDPSSEKKLRLADFFALGTCFFGLCSLIGYMYGVDSLYGLRGFTPMALNMSISLILLSLSVILYKPESGLAAILFRKDSGGKMARILLPAVLLAPICFELMEIYAIHKGFAVYEVAAAFRSVATIGVSSSLLIWSAASISKRQRAFEEQTQILHSIMNSISDGIIVADPKGHVILSNPAADRLNGFRLQNSDPSTWREKMKIFYSDQTTPVPPDQLPLFRAIHGQETNDFEIFIVNRVVNSETFFSVSGRPLVNPDGINTGGLVALRDISMRKKHEKMLKSANEELELKVNDRMKQLMELENQVQQLQKMDAVGRLAGGVAHDFNNLLAAVMMYCEQLNDDSAEPQKVLESSKGIKQIAERGATLTRQLLVFSRKQVIQYQSIDLNQLIGNFNKMLLRLIGENISIETSLGENLKPIRADQGQIEQVIMNLVINARDAMPEGGKIKIETSSAVLDEAFTKTHLTTQAGEHVLLSISDTGVGMDTETQNKIFEPFFTTKPVGKGTGLGLSTVYGIIKQLQGTVWVYSEIGKGAVFHVYLPVTSSQEIHVEHEDVVELPNLQEHGTILLVEDDEELRALFSNTLRHRGYDVLVSKNGSEAVEFCRKHPSTIDLLMTDLTMPDISGFELAKIAERFRPELKILYMSGYTNESVTEAIRGADGKVSFLQKPFDKKTLISKIREMRIVQK